MLADHASNFVSHARIGRVFEHADLRHSLFRESERACRGVFLHADAIIASSIMKSGKSVRPTIGRDVTSSPIDFAISTSLIQCIEIRGYAGIEQTSVLKLTFQLGSSIELGNFPRCSSEIGNLR